MQSIKTRLESYRDKAVLVTGATGFTGRAVTHKLLEAGARVRAIARPTSNLGDLADAGVKWFTGDVFDPELVREAVADQEYVFHLAAAFREEKSTEEDFRRVHLASTQLLAREVVGRPAFKCFVHVSTVGVHGHIESGRADENYRFAPGDEYQRTKLEGEQWIRQFGDENALPYAVVRPAPIFGPGDMRLLKIFRMVNKGYLLMLGKGRGMYHLVHVDDLSNTILLAGITPAALGEVLISAGDEPVSIEEMSRIIARALGKSVRTIRLPIQPFYWASDICAWVCKPLGIQPPIYRRRVDFYTKDRQFDNRKIKRVLDYEFAYDNERGLVETTNWYRDQGLLG
jgi:nucleoside-diphosphate-sugar epimerase